MAELIAFDDGFAGEGVWKGFVAVDQDDLWGVRE